MAFTATEKTGWGTRVAIHAGRWVGADKLVRRVVLGRVASEMRHNIATNLAKDLSAMSEGRKGFQTAIRKYRKVWAEGDPLETGMSPAATMEAREAAREWRAGLQEAIRKAGDVAASTIECMGMAEMKRWGDDSAPRQRLTRTQIEKHARQGEGSPQRAIYDTLSEVVQEMEGERLGGHGHNVAKHRETLKGMLKDPLQRRALRDICEAKIDLATCELPKKSIAGEGLLGAQQIVKAHLGDWQSLYAALNDDGTDPDRTAELMLRSVTAVEQYDPGYAARNDRVAPTFASELREIAAVEGRESMLELMNKQLSAMGDNPNTAQIQAFMREWSGEMEWFAEELDCREARAEDWRAAGKGRMLAAKKESAEATQQGLQQGAQGVGSALGNIRPVSTDEEFAATTMRSAGAFLMMVGRALLPLINASRGVVDYAWSAILRVRNSNLARTNSATKQQKRKDAQAARAQAGERERQAQLARHTMTPEQTRRGDRTAFVNLDKDPTRGQGTLADRISRMPWKLRQRLREGLMRNRGDDSHGDDLGLDLVMATAGSPSEAAELAKVYAELTPEQRASAVSGMANRTENIYSISEAIRQTSAAAMTARMSDGETNALRRKTTPREGNEYAAGWQRAAETITRADGELGNEKFVQELSRTLNALPTSAKTTLREAMPEAQRKEHFRTVPGQEDPIIDVKTEQDLGPLAVALNGLAKTAARRVDELNGRDPDQAQAERDGRGSRTPPRESEGQRL